MHGATKKKSIEGVLEEERNNGELKNLHNKFINNW
jgi:hypothetical protein